MAFWDRWRKSDAEIRDRQERELLLSFAPGPEQQRVTVEREAEWVGLEAEHRAVRQARQRLAADAEWD